MSKHSALNTFGRSGNPAFTRNFTSNDSTLASSERMTLDGAVNKTSILLVLCFLGAGVGWNMPVLSLTAGIIGFILGMVTIFRSPSKAGSTFGILASLLFCYKSGIIKPTENFRLMIFSATAGIALLYLISFIMSFFGNSIGFIHSNGLMGIGFSVFVVGIAALNLVLDFDFIEEGAEEGMPKYMEWYGAFSLMVTLIWLYLEILRLLMKLNSRR